MPTLQVRDLPEPVYRILRERARQERRSLARQAIVELERLIGIQGSTRRLQAIARIRERLAEGRETAVSQPPERVVREDRER